jgi:hypothetical protein
MGPKNPVRREKWLQRAAESFTSDRFLTVALVVQDVVMSIDGGEQVRQYLRETAAAGSS